MLVNDINVHYQVEQMEDVDHEEILSMTAKKLDSLRKSNLIKSLNISKSVSSLDDSLRNSTSPLIQGNMMYLFLSIKSKSSILSY